MDIATSANRKTGRPAGHEIPLKLSLTELSPEFLTESEVIYQRATQSLLREISDLCEGAIIVNRHARVVWISEKYVKTLRLGSAREALGREIELNLLSTIRD